MTLQLVYGYMQQSKILGFEAWRTLRIGSAWAAVSLTVRSSAAVMSLMAGRVLAAKTTCTARERLLSAPTHLTRCEGHTIHDCYQCTRKARGSKWRDICAGREQSYNRITHNSWDETLFGKYPGPPRGRGLGASP